MTRRVRRPPFRACRRCRALVPREAERCPACGSTDLTDDWEGALIIVDPSKSLVAKKLEVDRPGRYAVRVH